MIVPVEKFLTIAKETMVREVFKQELADRPALVDEFLERVLEATINEILAKIPARKADGDRQAAS